MQLVWLPLHTVPLAHGGLPVLPFVTALQFPKLPVMLQAPQF
jgi:hypothetical protein